MQILRSVYVKQILTEKSKQDIHDKYVEEKRQLQLESQQLLFEQRKLKHKFSSSDLEIKQRFDAEIERRHQQIELIDFQIEELESLDIGSEVLDNEATAIIDVHVGDSWKEVTKRKTIVVKDGEVIRID